MNTLAIAASSALFVFLGWRLGRHCLPPLHNWLLSACLAFTVAFFSAVSMGAGSRSPVPEGMGGDEVETVFVPEPGARLGAFTSSFFANFVLLGLGAHFARRRALAAQAAKTPAQPLQPRPGALPVNVIPNPPLKDAMGYTEAQRKSLLAMPAIPQRWSVIARTDEPGQPRRLLFLQCAAADRETLLEQWAATTNRGILDTTDFLKDSEADYSGVVLHQEYALDSGVVREMRQAPAETTRTPARQPAVFSRN